MNLTRLADILIEKIKRDYPNDVSLVHVHGSYAYGDTHERSDLDLYFVPKTERGYRLGCTFILEGIGCDFWALGWERLERIAAHEEKIASIITDGTVLYYGSDEDKRRFEALRQEALTMVDSEKAASSALEKLEPAYKACFYMQRAQTLADVRKHAIDLIYALSFALAELNQTPVKRGRRLLKQELLAMPLVPANFAALYDTAFFSHDFNEIRAALGDLLAQTEKLIHSRKNRKPAPFQHVFAGWYEEMIQSYNKIYHACETGDAYTPLFAAVEFSSELDSLLAQVDEVVELPELIYAYDPDDLSKIAAAARQHQAAFEALLSSKGVPVRRFSSFEEVEAYLDTL